MVPERTRPSDGRAGDADGPRTESDGATSRRRLLSGAAALAAVGTAGCIQIRRAETVREERYDPPDGTLSIVSREDDVSIERTETDAIEVRARKRYGPNADAGVDLETTRTDGDLRIGVPEHDSGTLSGATVDLAVGVPSGVSVASIETDDGDVAVADVEGPLSLTTSDGDVVASNVAGDVAAETGDGDVSLEGIGGYVTASSADGDVTISNANGVDAVTTHDGDVRADLLAVRGDVSVATDDGDVIATVGPDLDATVVAATDDGEVTADAEALDTFEEETAAYVRGRVGDGTHRVRCESADGDVVLRPA
jgi:hypothetical protein